LAGTLMKVKSVSPTGSDLLNHLSRELDRQKPISS
jgi:hypothetical protein